MVLPRKLTVLFKTWACHEGVFGFPRVNGESFGHVKGLLIDCEIYTVLCTPGSNVLLVGYCYHETR